MSGQKILVVDDELDIREGLAQSLCQMGFDVMSAGSAEEALGHLKSGPHFRLLLTDYKMSGMNGFDLLKEAKKISPEVSVVMMTAYGNVNHAVEAMQQGASDYLCKPFKLEDLERIIIKETAPTASESFSIITEDPEFLNLLAKAKRAARSSAPILIEGPSGTGKELLARQIHDWSDRASRPWVAINCAALPSGLLESELFGFERGAFTGAVEKRSGKFEQADTGTLLLDEIGELDPLLQAKLLRVLQEGEIDRLGGRRPQKIDVRIIATTNRNLEELVRKGLFREDLYFRLYGVRFLLPALKDRAGDISILAKEFLKRQERIQKRHLEFAEGVLEQLSRCSWPGNIRELERSIERASILSESGIIEVEHFELPDFSRQLTKPLQFSPLTDLGSKELSVRSIKEMEKEIILKALAEHGGNRTHTARALGMSLRTLRHKIKQYREEGTWVEPYGQKLPGQKLQPKNFDARLTPSSGASSVGERIAYKE